MSRDKVYVEPAHTVAINELREAVEAAKAEEHSDKYPEAYIKVFECAIKCLELQANHLVVMQYVSDLNDS